MELFYTGKVHKIYLTDRAQKIFGAFKIEHRNQRAFAQLLARIAQFSDTGELPFPQQLNTEGDGFYAIKSRSSNLSFRAYWWKQPPGNRIFISHFITKNQQKLDPRDKEIMMSERDKYKGE